MTIKKKSSDKSNRETVETYGQAAKSRRYDRYWRRKGWKHNKRNNRK